MTIQSVTQPERPAPRSTLRLVHSVTPCERRLGSLRCTAGDSGHDFGCTFEATSGSYLERSEVNED